MVKLITKKKISADGDLELLLSWLPGSDRVDLADDVKKYLTERSERKEAAVRQSSSTQAEDQNPASSDPG